MPAKLDRCVKDVMAEGESEERAYAICTAAVKAVMAEISPRRADTPSENISAERAALAAERAALAAEGALQEARRIRESLATTPVPVQRWIRKAVLPLRQVAKDLPIYYAKVLCVHKADKQDDSVTPDGVAKIKAQLDADLDTGKPLEMGINHEGGPSKIFKALGTDIVGEDVELDGETFHKGDLVVRFFAPVRPNGVSLEGFDEDDLPGTHAKAALAKGPFQQERLTFHGGYQPAEPGRGIVSQKKPDDKFTQGRVTFHGAEGDAACPSCGEDLRHDKCPSCGEPVAKMIHGAWPPAGEQYQTKAGTKRFRPIYKEDGPECPHCGEDLRHDKCPKCGTPVAKLRNPDATHFKPYLSYR